MSDLWNQLCGWCHDPVDKVLDIPNHEKRAQIYRQKLGISGCEDKDIKSSDVIASCMERSFIPDPEKYQKKQEELYQGFSEIRHTLSEGYIKIPYHHQEKLDVKEIQSIAEKMYDDMGKQIQYYEDKKKFFYLWRNLKDRWIKNLLKNHLEITKYFSIIPADSRMPDHSIWEHLKIVSAVGSSLQANQLLQNNSLFLFSIGPVQAFIRQARKTQDFYAGSYILSFLTFKAMEVIIDEYGPTHIIFPELLEQPLMDYKLDTLGIYVLNSNKDFADLPTIPNRFVAILPITDEENVKKKIVKKIKEQIDKVLKEVKESALHNIKLNEAQKEKIENQLKEFPEIYWVCLPWKYHGGELSLEKLKDYFDKDYIAKYQNLKEFIDKWGKYPTNIGFLYEVLYSLLEKFMGSIKNLRKFPQTIQEKGRKCSVCGERDVVFFKAKNKSKFTRYNNPVVDLTPYFLITPKVITEGEGLCSICFLKRKWIDYLQNKNFISKQFSFPSISEIATADYKKKLKGLQIYNDYIKEFQNIVKKGIVTQPIPALKELFQISNNIEGEWLYEENLTRDKIQEETGGKDISEEDIAKLRKKIKEIYKKAGKPSSYYAIIYFDGDNMGKWLSGSLLPPIRNSYHSKIWEKISQEFRGFKDDLLKKLPENEDGEPRKLLTPAIHSAISEALKNYTLRFVKLIVEKEHLGKIIYAGGDDVFALVNLKDLFEVMRKLRWAFSGNIQLQNANKIEIDHNNKTGFVEDSYQYILTMGNRATGSMEVTIAHYKTPLQLVIQKTQEMEAKSKGEGRDRFSICLMKRSGEERIITYPWAQKVNDKYIDVLEIFKEIEVYFKKETQESNWRISRSFIYKTFEEMKELTDLETKEIFRLLLERNLKRSIETKDQKIIDKKVQEAMEKLELLFWEVNSQKDIRNFFNTLVMIHFIANLGEV